MDRSHRRGVVALLVAAFAFSWPLTASTAAVNLNPAQAAVLRECQQQWAVQLPGWATAGNCTAVPGADCDCATVYGVQCDADGSIVSMHVTEQPLNGPVPSVLGELTTLTYLRIAKTDLNGSIPDGLSSLVRLQHLDLSYNSITGSIPQAISSLTSLTVLGLSYMDLTGPFPSWIPGHIRLNYVSLVGNRISGSMPESLGSVINLNVFSVWQNQLSGTIPESIGSLTQLEILNQFTGSIPQGIGNMERITTLDLGDNKLNGLLPSWITRMATLEKLDLSRNNFAGSLPANLGSLQQLTYLNVSATSLACPLDASTCVVSQSSASAFCLQCPSFCSSCSSAAAAPPPPATAATATAQSRLSTADIIGIVVAAVLLLLLLLAAVWWALMRRRKPHATPVGEAASSAPGMGAAPTACQQFPLDVVTTATGDWAECNLLGSGGFGEVYKGVSPLDGTTLWAVKRAKSITTDFRREVGQMASKHHPNLVRLLGFAVGGDVNTRVENVLVYEFIANGDLKRWMGPDAPAVLTLQQRLDILVGVARGLEYLHKFGMVHRDIKPPNILIDENMQPKVADFGLVRAGDVTGLHSTRLLGTVGYMDPAYIRTHNATTATDLYSFGILMLVMLSGREAVITTKHKQDDGSNCHADHNEDPITILQWATELMSESKVSSLGDPRMAAVPEAIISGLVQLAVGCTAMPTASRPSMSQVAQDLEALRAGVGGGDARAEGAALVDEKMVGASPVRTMDEDLALLEWEFTEESAAHVSLELRAPQTMR
ncbi:hypothetical protein CLOM_g17129 [Closterium sp. NIES-68]|nr:hypothetical protein CLOM_g17129 [Closterium sp. NIES-68]GJP76584.1 hypothetical protein CLOP_g7006 [Closterium sp. NIES-67]